MKKIGISVYPDFDNQEVIKKQLDTAKSLGYRIVFTSLQLGDLGFENTKVGINDQFMFLFQYCHELGLEIHADINDKMFAYMGATPDNLEPIYNHHIKVLRLDGGFTDEDVATMTKNTFDICIEENASMLHFPKRRIETVVRSGNPQQYYACHNFFPLNDTGLSYQDAFEATKLFKQYGIKVGIFIGSLYSSKELNAVGRGVVTIESHRYLPAHIQAMELFANKDYDYVVFGDSHPTYEELKRVSEVARNDDIEDIKMRYHGDDIEDIAEDFYCIELPVWFDAGLPLHIKEELSQRVFLARADQPLHLIRATQSRGLGVVDVYAPLERKALTLTMQNCLANRYCGEIQIPLVDLPSVEHINVIGSVKPHAEHLVSLLKYGHVAFVLKEE